MATTYTGRLLTTMNYGVPALLDIAVQLGRIPRFAGATRIWPWSVLHHVALCDRLAQEEGLSAEVRAYLLLHDSAECALGDIPSTWKNAETKAMEERLLRRTLMHYGVRCVPSIQQPARDIDLRALVAEMYVLGPPNVLQHSGLDLVECSNGDRGTALAVYQEYKCANCSTSEDGTLVRWFLKTVNELLVVLEEPIIAPTV